MICNRLRSVRPKVIPTIDMLSQNVVSYRGSVNLIYIDGENFRRDSVVELNGIRCFSFFNGSNQLGFIVPWNEIETTGEYEVQVMNVGLKSNIVSLYIGV